MTDPTPAANRNRPASLTGDGGHFLCDDDLAIMQAIDGRIMADSECSRYLERVGEDMRRRAGDAIMRRLLAEPDGLHIRAEWDNRDGLGEFGEPVTYLMLSTTLSRPTEARLVPMPAMPDGSWRSVWAALRAFGVRLWSRLREHVSEQMADARPLRPESVA